MSAATRRRAVFWAVLIVGVWPIVQIVLVAGYDVSPWRFAGWGMYSQPVRRVSLEVQLRQQGERVSLRQNSLPPQLRQEIQSFSSSRDALGRLLEPDSIGESVLEIYVEAEEVWIIVNTDYLDASTATVKRKRHRYLYRR